MVALTAQGMPEDISLMDKLQTVFQVSARAPGYSMRCLK